MYLLLFLVVLFLLLLVLMIKFFFFSYLKDSFPFLGERWCSGCVCVGVCGGVCVGVWVCVCVCVCVCVSSTSGLECNIHILIHLSGWIPIGEGGQDQRKGSLMNISDYATDPYLLYPPNNVLYCHSRKHQQPISNTVVHNTPKRQQKQWINHKQWIIHKQWIVQKQWIYQNNGLINNGLIRNKRLIRNIMD